MNGWLGKNSVINKLILVLLLAYRDYAGRLNSAQTLFELCLSIAAQITHGPGAPRFSSEAKICSFCAVSNLWPCLCISDKARFFGVIKETSTPLDIRIPCPGTPLLDGKSVCSLGSYQFFPYACKTFAKQRHMWNWQINPLTSAARWTDRQGDGEDGQTMASLAVGPAVSIWQAPTPLTPLAALPYTHKHIHSFHKPLPLPTHTHCVSNT